MIYEIGKYRIKPGDSRLDWELYEYREVTARRGEHKGETREDWVSLGKYPSTFGHALEIIHQLMLMDGDDMVKGLQESVKTCLEAEQRLMSVTMPKDV